MSIVLNLPPELEHELAAEAADHGLPLPEYVLQILTSRCHPRPHNGAKLLAYWQREGLVGTRPEITDAPARARELRGPAQH